MEKEVIDHEKVPKFGPYGPAVKTGPLKDEERKPVWIAGVVPTDEDGEIIAPGDIRKQAEKTVENFRLMVEAADGSLSDVVRMTIYVTEMREYMENNVIHKILRNFDEPAETLVGVDSLAHEGQTIEIEGLALVK